MKQVFVLHFGLFFVLAIFIYPSRAVQQRWAYFDVEVVQVN